MKKTSLCTFVLAASIMALAGCAFREKSKTETDNSKHAADIHVASERTSQQIMNSMPEAAVAIATNGSATVIPLGNSISSVTKITSKTATQAESDDRSNTSTASASSIPFAVKLMIGAVALIVLWFGVWLWRRTSPAVDAAIKAGDRAIATAISHVENAISTSTDPAELVKLNAHRASLEKERGKLNAKVK